MLILGASNAPVLCAGGRPLDQLKADIAAAPTNGAETRVELTGNITDFTTDDIITIQEGQNIVLDMNGLHHHLLQMISAADLLVNYGTLTMTGNGTIDSSVSDAGGFRCH